MRLATIRTGGGTKAVRIDDDSAVETGHVELVELLAEPDWRAVAAAAAGPRHELADLDYASVVVRPEKIICVGLNYRKHILEMGRGLPEYPTLFAKYSRALIGAFDDITLPAVSSEMDWEAELGVVEQCVVGELVEHEPDIGLTLLAPGRHHAASIARISLRMLNTPSFAISTRPAS